MPRWYLRYEVVPNTMTIKSLSGKAPAKNPAQERAVSESPPGQRVLGCVARAASMALRAWVRVSIVWLSCLYFISRRKPQYLTVLDKRMPSITALSMTAHFMGISNETVIFDLPEIRLGFNKYFHQFSVKLPFPRLLLQHVQCDFRYDTGLIGTITCS